MRVTRKLGLLVGVAAVGAVAAALARRPRPHPPRPDLVAGKPVRREHALDEHALARRVTWTEAERERLRRQLATIALNPPHTVRPLARPPSHSLVPDSGWFHADPEQPSGGDGCPSASPSPAPPLPPGGFASAGAAGRRATATGKVPATRTWRTTADPGWRAAQRAANPRPDGATHTGLPRRRPGAQLVPGAPTGGPAPTIAATDRRDPAEIGAVAAAYWHGIASSRTRHTTLDGSETSAPSGNDGGAHENGVRT